MHANTSPVSSYRYLLSTSADNSITIAVIGFFDNMYDLLNSGPDQISPHTGAELLSTKVRELVVQANDVGMCKYLKEVNIQSFSFCYRISYKR